ncbi:MAG: Rieske (2Fe-2S) protein, partial [Candidatus Nitrosocosmicus sp.]
MKIDSFIEESDNNDSPYRYICLTSEISIGNSKSFSIKTAEGKDIEIAVFNIDGVFYAISNTCIHKGG